ncbi:deoxyribodipyrimidine photo-lyase [Colwellia sp. KU-HH00111]|uniref:deoxyribodipyrimidine photo-lyase n=1 Tax=Colwellia sp. KU-HH00111 TaxID=3127652 RepID=UPI003107CEC1
MLLWFRNDLRTHDNPALHHFMSIRSSSSPGKAIFFISEKQWQIHDWSPIKIDFILRHAHDLVAQLAQLDITLELIKVPDFSAQVTYLKKYCLTHNIQEVIANSEVEFNEQTRDQACIDQGISLTLFESDVIAPKGKILNKSGEMFKVFTPFKRAWLHHIKTFGFDYLGKPILNTVAADTQSKAPSLSSGWPLATDYEKHTLGTFFQDKLINYQQDRDMPFIKGTSGISPYLAAGVISPRYVLRALQHRSPDILLAIDSPEFAWLNEIIWRDFYRHLMYHQQKLCKHQCFNSKYDAVHWLNNESLFNAWCQGKTGYPLVDAAMRQLNQTGWMHNRLRMVVASFLTKHLLIDWRKGEKYFMQHLIDGDLAANNGGWQWAASTGCDAQPYFRIFNPIRQSERFDPKGEFIRKYIPELVDIPNKDIHFPHGYIKKNGIERYWPAIVDHKTARENALAFYKVL